MESFDSSVEGRSNGMKKIFQMLMAMLMAVTMTAFAAGCGSGEAKSASAGGAPLTIRMLDIGQGDAMLLEKDGEFVLIDAGDVDHRPQMQEYLAEYGVKELSKVIVTHAHADHMGGMYAVFKAVPVKDIYDNAVPTTTNTYRTYLKQIKKLNIPFHKTKAGDTISLFKDVDFAVVAPVKTINDGKSGNPDMNNNSIVGRLTYGDFSMLFTGDAEKEEERTILDSGAKVKSDILKVAHHGSKTSSSAAFIKEVSPKLALISAGAGNSYGLPHNVTLKTLDKAGIKVLRTDQDGTITITTGGSGYEVTKTK